MEKLSLASWSNTGIKNLASLIIQNAATLKVLDMSYDLGLSFKDMKHIMSNCVNLTEVSFSNSRLSSQSTEALLKYLPPNILKLNLAGLTITDDNICKMVTKCRKIIELDLCGTRVTLKGVICIVNNLSTSLTNLWLPKQIGLCLDQSPNLPSILKLASNLKHLWWKSNAIPSMSIQSEMYHLKKHLPHLTINEVSQTIANPSVPFGRNGMWEVECKQVELFSSHYITKQSLISSWSPHEP